MKTGVKEFLETYELYKRFHPRTGAWWNGEWPEAVDVFCHVCGETGSHTIWPSKVAGVTPEWGVYMIDGMCQRCSRDSVMFWVEVNLREGWMQKAGQLPAVAVAEA